MTSNQPEFCEHLYWCPRGYFVSKQQFGVCNMSLNCSQLYCMQNKNI